ncbi:MAG: hypothetical protein WCY08_12955, partial [Rhodocyclaceae bacterium]
VVLRRLVPGERIDEVHDLQEMGAMLAERVVEWTENWKQQGLQESRRSIALRLIALGVLSDEQIAEATQFSLEEIHNLREQAGHV